MTRNDDNAGTDSSLNLTINIDGLDSVDYDYYSFSMGKGEAGVNVMKPTNVMDPATKFDPFDSSALTNSSIRLGIRGDNMWLPQHVLLLGRQQNPEGMGEVFALAVEVDTTVRLSTDNDTLGGDGGNLSMPIRLVGYGTSTTLIRRVLWLVETANG
jgi:hypothetical protein